VYIVSNALRDAVSSLHNSVDGGDTFTKVDLPFKLVGSMIFHPSIWDLILASDESLVSRCNARTHSHSLALTQTVYTK